MKAVDQLLKAENILALEKVAPGIWCIGVALDVDTSEENSVDRAIFLNALQVLAHYFQIQKWVFQGEAISFDLTKDMQRVLSETIDAIPAFPFEKTDEGLYFEIDSPNKLDDFLNLWLYFEKYSLLGIKPYSNKLSKLRLFLESERKMFFKDILSAYPANDFDFACAKDDHFDYLIIYFTSNEDQPQLYRDLITSIDRLIAH